MSDIDDMNEGQEALAGAIKTLLRLAKLADKKADALCKEGNNSASAQVGSIEVALLEAHAAAKKAYRFARGIDIPVEGEIVAFGGGK